MAHRSCISIVFIFNIHLFINDKTRNNLAMFIHLKSCFRVINVKSSPYNNIFNFRNTTLPPFSSKNFRIISRKCNIIYISRISTFIFFSPKCLNDYQEYWLLNLKSLGNKDFLGVTYFHHKQFGQ